MCSGLHINIILHDTQEHDIGQGFALYYIAHAAYLELRGSYARADAVLQEGVRRCAAPTAFTPAPHSNLTPAFLPSTKHVGGNVPALSEGYNSLEHAQPA